MTQPNYLILAISITCFLINVIIAYKTTHWWYQRKHPTLYITKPKPTHKIINQIHKKEQNNEK